MRPGFGKYDLDTGLQEQVKKRARMVKKRPVSLFSKDIQKGLDKAEDIIKQSKVEQFTGKQ